MRREVSLSRGSLLLGLLSALLLSTSCRGLNPEAKKVRVYQSASDVAACKNLGEVNAHASGWGERYKADAIDDAREKAVDLGGDSVIVLEHDSGFSGHVIRAGVYACGESMSVASANSVPGSGGAPPVVLEKPESVLVLEFKMLDGEQRIGKIFTNLLSAELTKIQNLNVLSPEDLEATLQVERQKDLLGCDDVSCLAEIAGAMGTSLILHGSVGSIGSQYAVNTSLFDSRLGKARGRTSHTVAKSEDALVEVVGDVSRDIASQLAQ